MTDSQLTLQLSKCYRKLIFLDTFLLLYLLCNHSNVELFISIIYFSDQKQQVYWHSRLPNLHMRLYNEIVRDIYLRIALYQCTCIRNWNCFILVVRLCSLPYILYSTVTNNHHQWYYTITLLLHRDLVFNVCTLSF